MLRILHAGSCRQKSCDCSALPQPLRDPWIWLLIEECLKFRDVAGPQCRVRNGQRMKVMGQHGRTGVEINWKPEAWLQSSTLSLTMYTQMSRFPLASWPVAWRSQTGSEITNSQPTGRIWFATHVPWVTQYKTNTKTNNQTNIKAQQSQDFSTEEISTQISHFQALPKNQKIAPPPSAFLVDRAVRSVQLLATFPGALQSSLSPSPRSSYRALVLRQELVFVYIHITLLFSYCREPFRFPTSDGG